MKGRRVLHHNQTWCRPDSFFLGRTVWNTSGKALARGRAAGGVANFMCVTATFSDMKRGVWVDFEIFLMSWVGVTTCSFASHVDSLGWRASRAGNENTQLSTIIFKYTLYGRGRPAGWHYLPYLKVGSWRPFAIFSIGDFWGVFFLFNRIGVIRQLTFWTPLQANMMIVLLHLIWILGSWSLNQEVHDK